MQQLRFRVIIECILRDESTNSPFPSFRAVSECMHNDMAPATLSFEVNST